MKNLLKKRHCYLTFVSLVCIMLSPLASQGQITSDSLKNLKEAEYSKKLADHPFTKKIKELGLKNAPLTGGEKRMLSEMQNFIMTMDPETQKVNSTHIDKIGWQIKEKQKRDKGKRLGDSPNQPWVERGPNNVGGRTRALIFDLSDATKKRVFAGGVDGGIWMNNDITDINSGWVMKGSVATNMAINCLAQDPNNHLIIYAGTGEPWGADPTQPFVRGQGYYRSNDGGNTWTSALYPKGNQSAHMISDMAFTNNKPNGTDSRLIAAMGNAVPNDGYNNALVYTDSHTSNGFYTINQFSPSSGNGKFFADIEVAGTGTNQIIYASTGKLGFYSQYGLKGEIFKSTDNGNTWSNIYTASSSEFPERIELAVAPSNPLIIYAIASNQNGRLEWFKKSINGGTSWTSLAIPTICTNAVSQNATSNFCMNQAWYDLILVVKPDNANFVLAGGIDIVRSTNGGTSFTQISGDGYCNPDPYTRLHTDQHAIMFRPGYNSEVIIGNDGGVYYGSDIVSTSPTISERNKNYNITQFYSCAINPTNGSNNFLAGAQDNGTQKFNVAGVNSTTRVRRGDGMFCHIDNGSSGNNQISSYYENNYAFTTNNWSTMTDFSISPSNSLFVNPTCWDQNLDKFYSTVGANYAIVSNIFSGTRVTEYHPYNFNNTWPTAYNVSPYSTTSTTLFVGTAEGRIYKVTNGQSTTTYSASNLTKSNLPQGWISSIELGANENEILITYSNYSPTKGNIWYSSDGGATWSNKDSAPSQQVQFPLPANIIPDMPIRWAVFNPLNRNEVYLATELGVWGTTNFNAATPSWSITTGFPACRTDMMKYRTSDNVVLAATHGRGLWSSVFRPIGGRFASDEIDLKKDLDQVAMYPNPANDYTVLEMPKVLEGKTATISIINSAGQVVKSLTSSSITQLVEVSNLPMGIYIVKTQHGDYIHTSKLNIAR